MGNNEKINVYILDEYISSQVNGIGKYISELVKVFKQLPDIDITMIEFNSPEKEFNIAERDNIKYVTFPEATFAANYFEDNLAVSKLLALYIDDSSRNIFFINHSPCSRLVQSLKEMYPLSKILFVVHDLSWTTPLLGDVEKVSEIMKNRDKPQIRTKYSQLLKNIDNVILLLNLVDYIICLSEDTHRVLQDLYAIDPRKIFFIPNFLTDTHMELSARQKGLIRKKHYINNNEKILLFVGRLTKPKGIMALINSFKKVLRIYPDCRLILVGNLSSTDEVFKACKSMFSKISFTGQISYDELDRLYRITDIGLVPSYSEQCSYSGIEMLMHGLPVVASDGFGVRNMFYDGVNASVAEIGHISKSGEFERNLAGSILKLLSSDKYCKTLSKCARQAYERKYSIEKAKKNYSNLFSHIFKI